MVSITVKTDESGSSQQGESQKSDPHCRLDTSSSSPQRNFRKAITPLRSIGAGIPGLLRIRLSLNNTDLMEVPTNLAVEDPTPRSQNPPMQPTSEVDAVEKLDSSDDDSEPPNRLVSLLQELLVEIMKHLDWRTILQLRKTCKVLYTVTTTKAVWLHLHAGLASSSRIKCRFERPLRLMTGRDLENAFFQRTGVTLGWTRPGLRRSRRRDVLDEDAERFHLVPGGRWLLVATLTGSVSYHDLDDPDIKERDLIPDQIHWNRSNTILMDVDVDRNEEEPLEFTLVLTMKEQNESLCQDGQNIASVWKVKLQLNEEGQAVGLSATRVAIFTLEKHGSIQSLSILGTLICYSASNYFAIVDWERDLTHPYPAVTTGQDDIQIKSEVPRRRVIYSDQDPEKMRLLPGNQVVIASFHDVKLYKLKDLPLQHTQVIPREQTNITTECPWSARMPSISYQSLSRPFLVSDTITTAQGLSRTTQSVRLLLFSHRGIYGLHFPLDDSRGNIEAEMSQDETASRVPTTFKLVDSTPGPSTCSYALGYNRAVSLGHYLPQLGLLHYSWPDDVENVEPTILSKKIVGQRWHRTSPFIDEDTGRIVVSSNGGMRLVILDTSLYDTNSTTR